MMPGRVEVERFSHSYEVEVGYPPYIIREKTTAKGQVHTVHGKEIDRDTLEFPVRVGGKIYTATLDLRYGNYRWRKRFSGQELANDVADAFTKKYSELRARVILIKSTRKLLRVYPHN